MKAARKSKIVIKHHINILVPRNSSSGILQLKQDSHWGPAALAKAKKLV